MVTRLAKTRELIGRWSPMEIAQFGERVTEELKRRNNEHVHEPSGLISGGKLGQPTLWSVLDMLAELRAEHDGYTLGKFQRGHDVEARAINLLTGLSIQYIVDILDGIIDNPGWIKLEANNILDGEVYLQYKQGYRGGTGYVDLAQKTPSGELIFHEIKSSNKMAFDKVAMTGASAIAARKRGETLKPAPYDHHVLQLSYYCLGGDVNRGFIHYLNADDYRLISFAINPEDAREEIDKEIDDIQAAFILKSLPVFEPLFDFQRIKNYQAYGDEWNMLSPDELMTKLENEFPSAYDKLMTTILPTESEKQ